MKKIFYSYISIIMQKVMFIRLWARSEFNFSVWSFKNNLM